MPPVRLPFRVVHASSEADGHNASELTSPGPACKGWRSAEYCIYPQVRVRIVHCYYIIQRI